MWKFIVRGIQSLERRACRTNVYSQSSQDSTKNEVKTNLISQQNLLPSTVTSSSKSFCRWTKSAGAKYKKYNSEWNPRYTWSDAVSWSSILAAGWVVCQTLCLRKKIHAENERENFRSKLYDYAKVPFVVSQLTNFRNLEPRNIFPVTNCIGNKKSNLQDSDLEWTSEKAFGPITIEEAFKEIADEFSNIHQVVEGEFELHYGIKALKEKRYEDALTHFSKGAKLFSPGSIFNLGLCHELGIGTVVDQKKAAEYYSDAAAHDHADALYNLGVFYAQGKGDLPLNIDMARVHFTKAAQLGQVQAQQALDLEKAEIRSKKSNTSTVQDTYFSNINLEKNKIDKAHDVLLNNHMLLESMAESRRVRDSRAHSIQQIFHFFGFKDQEVLMVNDNCVPC